MAAVTRPPPNPMYRFHVQRESDLEVKIVAETYSNAGGWKFGRDSFSKT